MSDASTNARARTPVPLPQPETGNRRPGTFVGYWQRFSGLNPHSVTELPYPEFRERALRLIDEFKRLVRVELDEDYKLRGAPCAMSLRNLKPETSSAAAIAARTIYWDPLATV